MSIEELSPPTPFRNGHDKTPMPNGHDRPEPVVPRSRWDRGPQPALAKRVAAAKRRRAKAIEQGRRLFSRGSLGPDARIEGQLREASELYRQYVVAAVTILGLELLD